MNKLTLSNLAAGVIGLGIGLAAASLSRSEGSAKGSSPAADQKSSLGVPARPRVWLSRWLEREKAGNGSPIAMPEIGDPTVGQEEERQILRLAHHDLGAAIAKINADSTEPTIASKRINKVLFKPLCQADALAALEMAADHPLPNTQFALQYIPFDQYEETAAGLLEHRDKDFGEPQLRSLLSWWGIGDPKAARQWAEENLDPTKEKHAEAIVALAQNPEDLPTDFETALGNSSDKLRKSWLLNQARDFDDYPSEEFIPRAEQLLALAPDAERSGIRATLASVWIQSDPEPAMNWILEINDPQARSSTIGSIGSMWFRNLPVQAKNWLDGAPPAVQVEVREILTSKGLKLE